MSLERTDYTDPARPPYGKPTTRLATPNIFDLVVVEDVPISPGTFRRLPYKSPHPDYANNKLVLVWQGPVKAANNQINARRVYASEDDSPENWFNYAVKYSGDASTNPIYVRSYTTLREDYTPAVRGSTLTAVCTLKVTNRGSGYSMQTPPAVAITAGGGGTGATAAAIVSPDGKVIGLQLLTEGTGYTSNPTVAITDPDGTAAAAVAVIQPPGAVLVKEELAKIEDEQLNSIFVRVNRIYEVLPGPWIPFTRYDDNLGPIQGRRRAVLNTNQAALLTVGGKKTYEGRDGSSIVSLEIEEIWDDSLFPIIVDDYFEAERSAVEKTSQLIERTGLEEGTLMVSGGVATLIRYEGFNQFLVRMIVETWDVPGPTNRVPDRYDDLLGKVSATDTLVENTGQTQTVSATGRTHYNPSKWGFDLVHEIIEEWDTDAFPELLADTYQDERGAIDRSTQLVIAGLPGQEATITRDAGVVEKIWFESYNEFLLKKIVEHWVEVIVDDQEVTSIFGGGILDVTQRTDEPGVQEPDTGFLVVASRLQTRSPHEQDKITKKLSPDSAVPVLELTQGGSGYSSAPAVGFAGGTGSAAVATAILGKPVQSITVNNGGSGYAAPPVVGFADGGGGGAFAIAVLGFGIDTIIPSEGGSGYTTSPTVVIGGDGTGAAATAVLGKGVASIAITNPGTGPWDGIPVVVFSGDGTGAEANVVMGNPVQAITVTNGGSGYTSAPTVVFTGGGGSGATATATLSFAVASATVGTAGTGYASPPTVAFTGGGGGTGAAGTARLKVVGTPAIVAAGTGYTVGDVLTVGGGTSTTAAQLLVDAVTDGAITAVSIQTAGSYSVLPANPVAVTGGTGTGATFTLAWGVASITVTAGGSGYTSAPTIDFTGGSGAGATATAVLATTGVIASVAVTNGGTVGFTSVPAISFTGGGGTGGAATATLDSTVTLPSRIDIVAAGSDYTTAPTISFTGGGGTGLAATAALASAGSVKSVSVTAPGTGFTLVPAISFSGGGGSGAVAVASLLTTGSVKSVTIGAGGSFESVPAISFIGGGGTGAAGTAVLASTGLVKRLNLTTLGVYTVAPTVTFTGGGGTGAAAIYHIGDLLWPTLVGHHTDPTEGIVINLLKTVIPHGTAHPGRGNFVEDDPHDRWKTIRIVSAVDLSTLPLPEPFYTTHRWDLPPSLLSIEALWSDVKSKEVEAKANGASVSVSSGSTAGVAIMKTGGFRGWARAIGTRIFFFGPPPISSVPVPFQILTSSGSVILTATNSRTNYSKGDDGSLKFGDSSQIQIHDVDISGLLVGSYQIIAPTHYSPPQNALAVSGGGTTAAVSAYGTLATMTIRLPLSSPTQLISGQQILVHAVPLKWRFNVWVLELIRAIVP